MKDTVNRLLLAIMMVCFSVGLVSLVKADELYMYLAGAGLIGISLAIAWRNVT